MNSNDEIGYVKILTCLESFDKNVKDGDDECRSLSCSSHC